MPVDFKGKSYTTVAERINKLSQSVDTYSLTTEVVELGGNYVLMKATLKIDDNIYTGHAYEEKDSSFINKTSHIENAETSSIGRALASANLHGSGEFCSADELTNAINNQNSPKTSKTVPKSSENTQNVQTSISDDDDVITFGKHEGKKWSDPTVDDGYLKWIEGNNERYCLNATAELQRRANTPEFKTYTKKQEKALKDEGFDMPNEKEEEIPF